MDKFVTRIPRKSSGITAGLAYHGIAAKGSRVSEESGEPTTSPEDAQESVAPSSTTDQMKLYKDHLRYNPEWQEKWAWIDYNEEAGGMTYRICKAFSTGAGSWRMGYSSRQ